VLVLCELLVAVFVTILWPVLDRRQANYRKLNSRLRQAVRLVLALEMLLYGTDKFPLRQFGDLTLDQLIAPFATLTPFRLLWSFMSASKGYTMFGGLGEIVGGVLLLIPRTVALGALVSACVLANVLALNLFYDVPVKLFFFHPLLMALFLAAPELPRLARLLVLNRPLDTAHPLPLSERPRINRWTPVVVSILGGGVFVWLIVWSWKGYLKHEAELAVKPPYHGVWLVDDFAVSAPAGHSLFTDKLKSDLHLRAREEGWRKLIFEGPKGMVIQCGNDALDHVSFVLDTKTNRAALSDDDDPAWKGDLTLQNQGARLLALTGTVNGCEIKARLHRMAESEFRLTRRGFHLINERPF
jgi:uncharacterized membrane protein YphA (DoxX/SURF4 family)